MLSTVDNFDVNKLLGNQNEFIREEFKEIQQFKQLKEILRFYSIQTLKRHNTDSMVDKNILEIIRAFEDNERLEYASKENVTISQEILFLELNALKYLIAWYSKKELTICSEKDTTIVKDRVEALEKLQSTEKTEVVLEKTEITQTISKHVYHLICKFYQSPKINENFLEKTIKTKSEIKKTISKLFVNQDVSDWLSLQYLQIKPSSSLQLSLFKKQHKNSGVRKKYTEVKDIGKVKKKVRSVSEKILLQINPKEAQNILEIINIVETNQVVTNLKDIIFTETNVEVAKVILHSENCELIRLYGYFDEQVLQNREFYNQENKIVKDQIFELKKLLNENWASITVEFTKRAVLISMQRHEKNLFERLRKFIPIDNFIEDISIGKITHGEVDGIINQIDEHMNLVKKLTPELLKRKTKTTKILMELNMSNTLTNEFRQNNSILENSQKSQVTSQEIKLPIEEIKKVIDIGCAIRSKEVERQTLQEDAETILLRVLNNVKAHSLKKVQSPTFLFFPLGKNNHTMKKSFIGLGYIFCLGLAGLGLLFFMTNSASKKDCDDDYEEDEDEEYDIKEDLEANEII